jgi:glycosyltransferase involved in cell wall biosynthesis
MKITHLIYSFTTGGAETMLVDLANEEVKNNEINIVIINSNYNELLVDKVEKSVGLYFIGRKEGSVTPIPILKLNLLLLRLKSDTIHCHNFNLAPLLLPFFKKKAVLTVHDVGLQIKYYSSYKKLFAISKIVKADIFRKGNINSTLVYNGICCMNVLQKEKRDKGDSFKIVIVSRLVHEKKGQHLAIAALNILRLRGISNIYIDLIGSGISEEFLKELTKEYELTKQVSFLGNRDRDFIYGHLRNYDLLIQPSLFEGFGLTVAEGMAAQIPVLVSNVDGPMEIIDSGKYGYFFKSGDADNLAEKIDLIRSQSASQEHQRLIKRAYQHVIDNFDIVQTANGYLKNY